ncbi:phage tail domain-containing protein [Listeria seeligeri]|uniref:phage tail domain-containing protein n=1 Tax=Listeria seeligeri TaxID=1640 RepID=UPI0022EBA905|nr:phage tail domain-containing protein [Listeria seeligeri]
MTIQSKMYVLKTDSDEEIDVDSLACVTFLQSVRDAPQLSTTFYEFSGADGAVEGDSVFKSKSVTCNFLIQAANVNDYKLAEQAFYDFFYERKSYYVRFSRMPGIRYKVIPAAADIQLSDNGKWSKITLELNNFSGYGESATSSLNPQFIDDNYQFGEGLLADNYRYIHKKNRFSIYNPGSVTVDPRRNFLTITVMGDTRDNLVIDNQTTLERFECYREMNLDSKDILTINQTTPKLNGVAIGIDTNGGLISLAPGWNDLMFNNISRTYVTFDFYSLYT